MKPALLIVDDDEDIRTQLKWALCGDYTIFLAEDRASALEHLRIQRPAVVLLDLGLPPHPATPDEGFAILAQILGYESRAKVRKCDQAKHLEFFRGLRARCAQSPGRTLGFFSPTARV